MRKVVNGRVKRPASTKQDELRSVAIRELDRTRAGVIALGHPPEKEPPTPG